MHILYQKAWSLLLPASRLEVFELTRLQKRATWPHADMYRYNSSVFANSTKTGRVRKLHTHRHHRCMVCADNLKCSKFQDVWNQASITLFMYFPPPNHCLCSIGVGFADFSTTCAICFANILRINDIAKHLYHYFRKTGKIHAAFSILVYNIKYGFNINMIIKIIRCLFCSKST